MGSDRKKMHVKFEIRMETQEAVELPIPGPTWLKMAEAMQGILDGANLNPLFPLLGNPGGLKINIQCLSLGAWENDDGCEDHTQDED